MLLIKCPRGRVCIVWLSIAPCHLYFALSLSEWRRESCTFRQQVAFFCIFYSLPVESQSTCPVDWHACLWEYVFADPLKPRAELCASGWDSIAPLPLLWKLRPSQRGRRGFRDSVKVLQQLRLLSRKKFLRLGSKSITASAITAEIRGDKITRKNILLHMKGLHKSPRLDFFHRSISSA